MRQIDADTFEQELKEKLLPLLMEKYGKEEAMKGLHFSLQDCISNIQGQPTITQPERKTGKWETYIISMLDGKGCRCSKCGFEGVPYWNFCPNCGADMRGEQNEPDK